jgi:phenylpropionate dioxygenase-like ring-hydroxylating dioxygenase large terminal subunit
MYPLNAPAAYPRSQWYIAGYGAEFGSKTFGRRIFDEPIIFFRTEEGEPVALWGLCAHRFMPLENTETRSGSVVCPYHGYAYGADGRCHTIPTGAKPSPHARLKRYPVFERGPFVWIWMGDPDAADIDLLPDLADIGLGNDQSGWRIDRGTTFTSRVRAALIVDNLFDLSHLAFIHQKSVPGGEGLVMIAPAIDENNGRLRVIRSIPGIRFEPGTFLDSLMPVARGLSALHAELFTELYSPALINASGPNAWSMTEGGKKGKLLGQVNFIHGLTPETSHTTHYFGLATRNYCVEDDNLSNLLINQTDVVRMEDIEALEAVEQSLGSYASTRREISTKADEGAIMARRLLKNLIDGEHSSVPVGAA